MRGTHSSFPFSLKIRMNRLKIFCIFTVLDESDPFVPFEQGGLCLGLTC